MCVCVHECLNECENQQSLLLGKDKRIVGGLVVKQLYVGKGLLSLPMLLLCSQLNNVVVVVVVRILTQRFPTRIVHKVK